VTMLVAKAFLLLSVLSGPFAVNLAELQGLYDLYNGLDGPNWLDNSNWLTGDPCVDAWHGIVCSFNTTTGHVRGILLESNLLSGELPLSITNLYDCEDLSLSQNNIKGSIPEEISVMRNLETIHFQNNNLSNSIPGTLGTLLEYNLQSLNFSTNSLSGFVPDFFSGASTELSADLSKNPFYCPLPQNVEYTGASCLNMTVEHLDQGCISVPAPELEVYGSGFQTSSPALDCVLRYESLKLSTPAYVVSDTLLLCGFTEVLDFGGCTGLKGQRMVELFDFYLASEDYVISNVVENVPALNPSCHYGYNDAFAFVDSQPDSIGNIFFPFLSEAYRICELRLTNPYKCPQSMTVNDTFSGCSSNVRYSYSSNNIATLDVTCNENDPLCLWAPLSSSSSPQCPFAYYMWDYNVRRNVLKIGTFDSVTCNVNQFCTECYGCGLETTDGYISTDGPMTYQCGVETSDFTCDESYCSGTVETHPVTGTNFTTIPPA